MRLDILTLFPEMFRSPLDFSLIKKAREKSLIDINIINIREFTVDKHKTADDAPFGGGAGMVMKPEPLSAAINHAKEKGKGAKVILLTPAGEKFDQKMAKELSTEKHLILICGHYEGIDRRIEEKYIDREVSIGDYVLTGGELPALVLLDAVCRLIPGVVGEAASLVNDSFYHGLLDHPSYTRPDDFLGEKVPEVLRSGNHKEIDRFRRREAIKKTLFSRPELLATARLSDLDKELLEEIILE